MPGAVDRGGWDSDRELTLPIHSIPHSNRACVCNEAISQNVLFFLQLVFLFLLLWVEK